MSYFCFVLLFSWLPFVCLHICSTARRGLRFVQLLKYNLPMDKEYMCVMRCYYFVCYVPVRLYLFRQPTATNGDEAYAEHSVSSYQQRADMSNQYCVKFEYNFFFVIRFALSVLACNVSFCYCFKRAKMINWMLVISHVWSMIWKKKYSFILSEDNG